MKLEGLWRDPDFLKLWTGQAISQIGSRITREGIPLTAVLVLGASPFQMGLLSGASGASILLFGLFAGAWADRLRRRPILIVADLGRALALATVPLAAYLGRLSMAHLLGVAAVTGLFTVLFDVSYQAYLPSLVQRDQLLDGNSKLALTESVAEIAGPGLTGILVQVITAPIAILFDAISFFVSAVSIAWIRRPEPQAERIARTHVLREIADGLHVSWKDSILRALMARTAMGSFFIGFIASLYIVFAIRFLGLNAALLGVIITVGGIASLLGALIAERLVKRFGLGPTLIGASVFVGVGATLTPLARGPVAACAAVLAVSQLFDIAWPVYMINEVSLRQSIVPNHLLGRVNAAMLLLFRGLIPAGALVGGMLAEVIGVRATMLVGALGFLASNAWLILSPLRSLRELP